MNKIDIAVDFSAFPGPRYKTQGAHSGELFRETLLEPKFLAAHGKGETLVVRLDGVRFGYPTSFLEEAFGGLARVHGIEPVLNVLRFETSDEPMLIDEINGYIRDCHSRTPVPVK